MQIFSELYSVWEISFLLSNPSFYCFTFDAFRKILIMWCKYINNKVMKIITDVYV